MCTSRTLKLLTLSMSLQSTCDSIVALMDPPLLPYSLVSFIDVEADDDKNSPLQPPTCKLTYVICGEAEDGCVVYKFAVGILSCALQHSRE